MSALLSPAVDQDLRLLPDVAFPFDGLTVEGGDMHDPSLMEFDGTYVVVSTSGHEMAPVRTSTDLKNWKAWGPVFDPQPDWLVKRVPEHRSVWAPQMVRVGNGARLYYCASEKFGQNSSVIGVAECLEFDPKNPLKGWKDLGMIVESKLGDNFNAIDPDVLIGPDGRHWMVYGSYWSGMYQVELDPKTGLQKDPSKPPRHVASNSERNNPLEAPTMMYRDGWYYLFVTYGLAAQGIRSTYRIKVGRSKDPEGPFLGFDGKPMTEGGNADVLKSSAPMFGPGGGNVFRAKDGRHLLAYHFYDGRRHWTNDLWGRPEMQVREIMWSPDGWPLPGLPVIAELPKREKARTDLAGIWLHQADFGQPSEIELTRAGKIRPVRTAGSGAGEGTWKLEGDQLTMEWPRPEGGAWVDSLILHDSGQYYVGRNQTGRINRGIFIRSK